jgi:hypothetical protein
MRRWAGYKCAGGLVVYARVVWVYMRKWADMYNNDVGKGGALGCEAYEVN